MWPSQQHNISVGSPVIISKLLPGLDGGTGEENKPAHAIHLHDLCIQAGRAAVILQAQEGYVMLAWQGIPSLA